MVGSTFRKGGDIGLLITLVPKVLLTRSSIRWLNNFDCVLWLVINYKIICWRFLSLDLGREWTKGCLLSSPQTFIVTILYWILICWIIKLSIQAFQPLIVIYRRGTFVVGDHWGFTYIFRPLSYPFRSLNIDLSLGP